MERCVSLIGKEVEFLKGIKNESLMQKIIVNIMWKEMQ